MAGGRLRAPGHGRVAAAAGQGGGTLHGKWQGRGLSGTERKPRIAAFLGAVVEWEFRPRVETDPLRARQSALCACGTWTLGCWPTVQEDLLLPGNGWATRHSTRGRCSLVLVQEHQPDGSRLPLSCQGAATAHCRRPIAFRPGWERRSDHYGPAR